MHGGAVPRQRLGDDPGPPRPRDVRRCRPRTRCPPRSPRSGRAPAAAGDRGQPPRPGTGARGRRRGPCRHARSATGPPEGVISYGSLTSLAGRRPGLRRHLGSPDGSGAERGVGRAGRRPRPGCRRRSPATTPRLGGLGPLLGRWRPTAARPLGPQARWTGHGPGTGARRAVLAVRRRPRGPALLASAAAGVVRRRAGLAAEPGLRRRRLRDDPDDGPRVRLPAHGPRRDRRPGGARDLRRADPLRQRRQLDSARGRAPAGCAALLRRPGAAGPRGVLRRRDDRHRAGRHHRAGRAADRAHTGRGGRGPPGRSVPRPLPRGALRGGLRGRPLRRPRRLGPGHASRSPPPASGAPPPWPGPCRPACCWGAA